MTEAVEIDESQGERGTYVYGIVRADERRVPEGLAGLDGARGAAGRPRAGGGCAVGDIALERPPGRRADLVAYTKVLEALAEAGPVVPVRFGSVVPDDDVVTSELLAPRLDRFDELLSSLEGRAQFNVRATYHEAGILQEVIGENPVIAELREVTRDRDPDAVHPQLVRLGELVARAIDGKREADGDASSSRGAALVDRQVVRPGKGVDQMFDASFSSRTPGVTNSRTCWRPWRRGCTSVCASS